MFDKIINFIKYSQNQELLLCLLFILICVFWSILAKPVASTASKVGSPVRKRFSKNDPENEGVSDGKNAVEDCSDRVNTDNTGSEISEESDISDEENE